MRTRTTDRVEFNGFTLDLRSRSLSNAGAVIPLRPKSFDVLAYLVQNAGDLLNKDEIIAKVWPDVIATDESLARCISDVRSALNDRTKVVIRTVPGRGYLFATEVQSIVPGSPSGTPVSIPGFLGMRRGPATAAIVALLTIVIGASHWFGVRTDTRLPAIQASIAVLPFRNSSGDSGIEPFVTGLTADLNSALARVPEMLVIAENSTQRFKGSVVGVRHIGRELGVEHILTGSVQHEGERFRILVQLSETGTGAAVWSRRYDREQSRFLELQDDIVRNVLISLQVELTHGDTARYLSGGTRNLGAWLAFLEGYSEGFKWRKDSNLRARTQFSLAAELDPQWAAPVGGLAWTYREAMRRGWSDDPDADRESWLKFAKICIDIDAAQAICQIQMGNYYIENGRIEDGLLLRERALELAPNDINALSGLAWQLILTGDVRRGLELLQRAKLVSPIHPPWLVATEAYGFQMEGEYQKAIEGFRYALDNAEFPDWHARLAAVYAEMGDIENARLQARIFVEKSPNRTVSDLISILSIQHPRRTAQYAESLRLAGIPE